MLGSLSPSAMILKAAEFADRELDFSGKVRSLVLGILFPFFHFLSLFTHFTESSSFPMLRRHFTFCLCSATATARGRGRGRGGRLGDVIKKQIRLPATSCTHVIEKCMSNNDNRNTPFKKIFACQFYKKKMQICNILR